MEQGFGNESDIFIPLIVLFSSIFWTLKIYTCKVIVHKIWLLKNENRSYFLGVLMSPMFFSSMISDLTPIFDNLC